jgi:hypothetical protein
MLAARVEQKNDQTRHEKMVFTIDKESPSRISLLPKAQRRQKALVRKASNFFRRSRMRHQAQARNPWSRPALPCRWISSRTSTGYFESSANEGVGLLGGDLA